MMENFTTLVVRCEGGYHDDEVELILRRLDKGETMHFLTVSGRTDVEAVMACMRELLPDIVSKVLIVFHQKCEHFSCPNGHEQYAAELCVTLARCWYGKVVLHRSGSAMTYCFAGESRLQTQITQFDEDGYPVFTGKSVVCYI